MNLHDLKSVSHKHKAVSKDVHASKLKTAVRRGSREAPSEGAVRTKDADGKPVSADLALAALPAPWWPSRRLWWPSWRCLRCEDSRLVFRWLWLRFWLVLLRCGSRAVTLRRN